MRPAPAGGSFRLSLRRRIALALVAGIIAGAVFAAPAFAAPLSGKAVMGTAGSPFPQGLRLTIVRIEPSGTMSTKPDFVPIAPDGSFSFEGDPALSYLIGTIYQEVTYSTVAAPGELPGKQFKIFETTRDVSAVTITTDSVTAIRNKARSDTLEVLQLMNFKNSSDRTYIGEGGEDKSVLRLPVPEGVIDLIPGDPANPAGLAVTPLGLASTLPLQPGEISIAYLYKVRVPRIGWQLRREVFYPSDSVDLLVAEGLRLVAAPQFKFAENRTLGGRRYARYRMNSATPGVVIGADVGFPAVTGNGIWSGLTTVGAVIVAVMVLAAAVWRKRRPLRTAGRPAAPPSRERLIEQVAHLDEAFEQGNLARSEYDARRATLMDDLKVAPRVQ